MSRILPLLCCMALLACSGNQVAGMSGAQAAGPESGQSQVDSRVDSQLDTQTVQLTPGQSVALRPQGMSLQLLDFTDTRCPVDAKCIWAGHATVTLSLARPGAPAESLVIGTEAPPAMQLPYQASSGEWRFTLLSLEPRPTKEGAAPMASVRAKVLIEKR